MIWTKHLITFAFFVLAIPQLSLGHWERDFGTAPTTAEVVIKAQKDTLCAGTCVSVRAQLHGITAPFTIQWNTSWPADVGPHAFCPTTDSTIILSVTDAQGQLFRDTLTFYQTALPSAGPDITVALRGGLVSMNSGSPTGGTYCGEGIIGSGSTFDPLVTGTGSFPIAYRYNGCSDTLLINVVAVSAGPDTAAYPGAASFQLNQNFPTTGTWSGPNVSSTGWVTPTNSPDSLEVYFTALGVTDSLWVVIDHLSIQLPDTICQCDSLIHFIATPAGGYWDGPGVIDHKNGFFDGDTSGGGMHRVEYRVLQDTLVDSVLVKHISTQKNSVVACPLGNQIQLPNASPSGGYWTGPGVIDSLVGIVNADLNSGLNYNQKIFYHANDCVDTLVIRGRHTEVYDHQVTFCIEDGTVALNEPNTGRVPGNGNWSGPGVVDPDYPGTFDPVLAGLGTHKLYYDANGCRDSLSLRVINKPVLQDTVVCEDIGLVDLDEPSAAGYWKGAGIVDSLLGHFDPTQVGVGVHKVRYILSEGCEEKQNVEVFTPYPIDWGLSQTAFLEEDTLIDFAITPLGGQLYGNGVVGNKWNPLIAGAGTHELYYEVDQAGCLKRDSLHVTANSIFPPPTISFTALSNPVCPGQNATWVLSGVSGMLWTVTGTTGTTWTNIGNPGVSTNQGEPIWSTVTYTAVVTDPSSPPPNTATQTVTINVFNEPTVSFSIAPSYCSDDNLAILPTPILSDGSAAIGSYRLYKPLSVLIQNNLTQFDPSALFSAYGTGPYSLSYVMNTPNGCEVGDTVQFTINEAPTIVLSQSSVSVCLNDPAFSLTAYASVLPNYFTQSNIQFTSASAGLNAGLKTFDPSAAGVGSHLINVQYTINGCSDVAPFTVIVANEADLSTLALPTNICENENPLSLGDPPGTTGTWSIVPAGAAGLTNPGGIGWVFNPDDVAPANNYTLTYTPVGGCPTTHDIFVDPEPDVTFVPIPNIACAGTGTFQLTGFSYISYSGLGGVESFSVASSPAGAPPLSISPTGVINLATAIPGVYTIEYEFDDNNSCSEDASADITILNAPSITQTSAINLCNGGADIDLNNSFSPPGGTYVINGTTLPSSTLSGSASFLTPTGNSLTYTYDNGTCSSTYSTSFDLQSGPVIGIISSTFQESCPGAGDATIVFNVLGNTGPLSYVWSNGSISSVPYSGLGVGSYTVTVSDATNCYSVETFQVTSPTAISGSAVVTNVSTSGGSDGAINLTPAGGTPGYTYTWSNGLPSTQDQSNIPAGTYNVTITDNNGCTGVLLGIQVAQPGPLVASGIAQNITCNGQANGSIDLTVGGGFTPPNVPSYIYQWSHAAGTEDVSGLAPGIYSVTVSTPSTSSDVETLSFTITEPTALTLSGVVNSVPCFAQSNGSIVTSVSGGTPPYTYLWDNGFVTPDRTNLLAGDYTLTVTDNNGCIISQTFTVTQPSGPFNVGFNPVNITCFGGSDGEVNLTLSGATPPYSYLWSNGETTQSIQNLTAGTYTLSVEDANGCTFFYPLAVVNEPPAIVVSGTVTDVTSFGAMDGAITSATSGGTPNYSYAWSGPNAFSAVTPNISNLNGGNYTLTVTDISGCTSIQTFTVTEPGQLTVTSLVTNETCVGSSDGAIDLTISSNGPPTILWSNGTTTEDLSNLAVGSYTVTITDGPQVFDSTFTIGTSTILDFNLTLPNDSFCLADALPLLGTNTNSATEVYKIDGQIVTGPVVPLSTYSVGPHLLTYIVSSGGCTDSTSLAFELLEPYPVVPQPSVLVCSTGLPANLTVLLNSAASIALPDTGRWYDPSGALLPSSTFNPTTDPYGIYTYRISNFCDETPYPIDILPIVNPIVFSAPSSLCPNDGVIDINSFVTPAGGTWTGGTTTGTFDPSLAIPGDTIWFYYSTSTAGCSFIDSTSIHVLPFTAVQTDPTLVPTLCTADSSVTLQFASPAGGTYSSTTAQISAVGADYVLDPAASGPATHVIWYHYNDAVLGCSDSASVTLTINAATPTAIGPFIDSVCIGAVPVTLPIGLPAGGQLSGPGVVGTDFDPASAGLGTHDLIYSFANDPCFTADTIQVTVTPPPPISMPNFGPICSSDPVLPLTGATPAGGTWIGPNIVNNQFIPGLAGAGVHELVYFYNLGGSCERYDTTTITVLSGPSLSLNTIPSICAGDPSVALNVVNPAGGSYSGFGVQQGTFNPQVSGVGSHSVDYSYTNGQGCVSDTSFIITVSPLPVVTLLNLPSFCEEDTITPITNGSPTGGTYSGNGIVNGNEFDPGWAGAGSHFITYTFTDFNGCSNSDFGYIEVYPTPPTPHINKVYNYLVCDWGFYDYQWYLNGVPIPNSNFIKWNAVDTGYYQVQLINEWGCTNISDSLNVDFLYQVGVEESHWSEVVLFPNPTSDWVRVELPIRPKALNYQWSNSMGQVVGEGTIESGNARQWSYDLSALPGGYYTLLLQDSDVSVRFKVLLQR